MGIFVVDYVLKTIMARRINKKGWLQKLDSILSGGILKQFLFLLVISIVLLVVMSFMYAFGGGQVPGVDNPGFWDRWHFAANKFMNFTYHPGGTAFQVMIGIICFIGKVLTGSLLIATITNAFQRRMERVDRGLAVYRNIRNHAVIIGYGPLCLSVIREELSSDSGRWIILMTDQNVSTVRAELKSHLDDDVEDNVIIYAGSMNSAEHISKLNLPYAKVVYILGEGYETGRDSKNLECAKLVKEARGLGNDTVLPVHIQLDKPSAYSTIKRLSLPRSYYASGNSVITYLRPFNFYENWARKLWGRYAKDYDNLDFEPLVPGSGKYVHLVIAGFDNMGVALLLEALRICHYPNGIKTRITVVDKRMNELLPRFMAHYSQIENIEDIEVEYVHAALEDAAVRKRLASWADDPDELLTVAVCFFDPDESIAASLSFPENLYYLIDGKGSITPNEHVKILVRQEVMDGVGGVLAQGNEKYRNVKIFGMVDGGVNSDLLKDDMAIWANAVYKGVDLDKVVAGGEEGSIETGKALVEWYGLSEEMRFSNRYQVEMYNTFGKYDRLNVPRACLHRMEHLRWCADRYIAGYRFCPGARREDKEIYKVHKDLIPFDELPEEDRNKDAEVVYNRQEIETICAKSKK